MSKVILYENVDFGGFPYGIDTNTPVIPPPMGSGDGQASSIHIYTNEWVTFWEGINFNQGNDQLWVAPPGPGYVWNFKNLHTLCRPHGNNRWGDRIRGVSFPGTGPSGDLDNILIVNSDGSLAGNTHACNKKSAIEIDVEKLSILSKLIPTLDHDASELRHGHGHHKRG